MATPRMSNGKCIKKAVYDRAAKAIKRKEKNKIVELMS